MDEVNFSVALSRLLNGKRIKRAGWPVWLYMYDRQIIVMDDETLLTATWQPINKDLLALDWVVEGE